MKDFGRFVEQIHITSTCQNLPANKLENKELVFIYYVRSTYIVYHIVTLESFRVRFSIFFNSGAPVGLIVGIRTVREDILQKQNESGRKRVTEILSMGIKVSIRFARLQIGIYATVFTLRALHNTSFARKWYVICLPSQPDHVFHVNGFHCVDFSPRIF